MLRAGGSAPARPLGLAFFAALAVLAGCFAFLADQTVTRISSVVSVTHGGLSSSISTSAAAPSVDAPLWVLHIPKTGTDFMVEAGYAACPSVARVPAELCMHREEMCFLESPGWPACAHRFAHMEPGHSPPTAADFDSGASFVGMFRDPTSRVASGYTHNFHDCS